MRLINFLWCLRKKGIVYFTLSYFVYKLSLVYLFIKLFQFIIQTLFSVSCLGELVFEVEELFTQCIVYIVHLVAQLLKFSIHSFLHITCYLNRQFLNNTLLDKYFVTFKFQLRLALNHVLLLLGLAFFDYTQLFLFKHLLLLLQDFFGLNFFY